MRRPAEVTTAASAYAFLLLYLLDRIDDPALLAAATLAIGHVPAVVTWVVEKRRRGRDGDSG